jgi:hypothetical protein
MSVGYAGGVDFASDEGHKGGLPLFTLLAVALVAFGLYFGNRVGYEGDDLVSIFGISALEVIGRDHVYRYAWQPLAYEALSWLMGLGLKSTQLTHVGNILGMSGLALLAVLSARLLGGASRGIGVALLLLLGIPELWITTLYFNTTALALPFFVGSLLALQSKTRLQTPLLAGAVSGVLFAIACLLRLDFLSALLFVAVLVFRWRRQWAATILWFVVAQALLFLVFFLAKPELPAQVALILTRYGEGEFRWPLVYSAKVLFLSIAPSLVTLPLLFAKGSPATLSSLSRDRPALLMVVAALPLLAPLAHLYSGKYLVVFFACAIVGLSDYLGQAWRAAGWHDTPSPRRQAAAALAIALMFVVGLPTLADLKSDPLRSMVLRPRVVMRTHDGPRTLGGYLAYASWHRAPESPSDYIELFRLTADRLTGCRSSATLVMPKTEWYWGVLLAQLVNRGWAIDSYDYPHTARLNHPAGGSVTFAVRETSPPDDPHAAIGPLNFTNMVAAGNDDAMEAALKRDAVAARKPCEPPAAAGS